MRRTAIAVAVALPVSVLTAACGGGETASGEGPTTVTVATAPIADYAPLYLGVEQGFFEDQGLEVEYASGRVGTETITAVLSGTTDFAGVALPPLLVADGQNLNVSVLSPSSVAPGEQDPSSVQLLTTPDSGFTSAADLEGATIAVNALQAQLELMTRLAVEEAGGNPDTLQFVEIPFPEMPAALQRGDVDAIAAVEPFLSSALEEGAVSIAEIDKALPEGAPVTAFFTGPQLAETDPELVDKFTAAMTESVDYAAEHPDEVRAIIPEYSEVSEEVAQKMVLPTYRSELDREGVTRTVEAMEQFGFLTERPDLDSMLRGES